MPDVTTDPAQPSAEAEPSVEGEDVLARGAPASPARRRWRPSPTVQLAAAIGATVLALAAAAVILFSGAEHAKVPSAAGLDYATATRLVREAGLEARIEPVKSPQPGGQIVSQSPRRGEQVDKGSTVTLRLSIGPSLASVPDVVRQSPTSAALSLEAAGLAVTVTRGPSSSVPAGKVASTSPPPYSQVNRGSKVTVTVSTGPQRLRVPSLVGLGEAQAQRQLQQQGFRVVIVRQESPGSAGKVVSQQPRAGRRARKGATVRLVVAAAPPAVTVPDVGGLDVGSAVTALSTLGLRIEIVDRRVSRGADGAVLSQSLPARSRRPKGSTITLTIAKR